MKPCSVKVGDRIESRGFPGTILTVSQVYMGDHEHQIVLQRDGMDFCRASESELHASSVVMRSTCECEHRDHFPDNDACPADCEACGADAHSLVAHPYGINSAQGVKLGAGGLYYCPACEAHEQAARRFA